MSLNQRKQLHASVIACLFTLSAGSTFAVTVTKSGPSVKLEQVIGDCDWAGLYAYNQAHPSTPQVCNPASPQTQSQTVTHWDVLGNDLGHSFMHNGNLVFPFGDTIGATSEYVANNFVPSADLNPFRYQAGDPIAYSSLSVTPTGESPLRLNFLKDPVDPTHALLVQPYYPKTCSINEITHKLQCNGPFPVAMGIDDVPDSGISIGGQIYIVVNTGAVPCPSNVTCDPHANSYSVLTSFDETSRTFTAGRTISLEQGLGGYFVFTTLHELPQGVMIDATSPQPDVLASGPVVLMFGQGRYRQSNIYLSYIPASEFWSGGTLSTSGFGDTIVPMTRYFTGLDHRGQPQWSSQEQDAVPVVYDHPTCPDCSSGTVGNASVIHVPNPAGPSLWLMTYDGGRQSHSTTGIYFTYAKAPWGDAMQASGGTWNTPQLIFNACTDGGFDNNANHTLVPGFMHYYYDPQDPSRNFCPSAVTRATNSSGPAGPTINLAANPPSSTTGGVYAPFMIEPFANINSQGNQLTIYYTMATWNPYTVVKMRSSFTITP